ncbi:MULTISPECIES: YppG family protein [unclassified Bacillus (in: firmicutes)]|uniref:YppG family protein n=1 Tax=unclassified Bacillus (in: firmicutes) TaxID=185979 RepID=UPI001BE84F5B|nr:MULTISPECIES: YppG family protein [unclassified Bacillus (in: firmicutes)]MBT2639061.1 YppG family protein [Bacillus sp. ISL-39]MBT2662330.1 YppG family protein [Bacillus sp. ISL-45]
MFGRRNKTNASHPQWWENQYNLDPNFVNVNNQGLNRQQPYPQQYNALHWNASPGNWPNQYIQQENPVNPYMQQGYPMNPYMQGNGSWNQPIQMAGNKNDYSKMLFQNPLEPEGDPIYGYYNPQNDYQNFNPYPQYAFMPKQPSGLQSIMNSFKSQDGNLDVNKMVDTAGQMMNAVTQVSSLVKGLGGMFKV